MVNEVKVEHVLILAIVAFLLYHFIGRCRCNGFRVGGRGNFLTKAADKLCKGKIDNAVSEAVAEESERGEQRRREAIMVFQDEMEICKEELEFMNERWAPEAEKQLKEMENKLAVCRRA